MATGFLVWGGVVALSLLALFLVYVFRQRRDLTKRDVLVAALLADAIVHVVGVGTEGTAFLAWSLVSFPLVGTVCWATCLLARWAFQRTMAQRPRP